MDLTMFKELAGSYGIFCALFIAMLLWQIKSNSDSIKRYEDREQRILERTNAREEVLRKEAREDKEQFVKTLEEYKNELNTLMKTHDSFKKELTRLASLIERLSDRIMDRK